MRPQEIQNAEGELHPIENGVITELRFFTNNVSNISPVRALAGLRKLGCNGSGVGKGTLSELSPIAGMKLTELSCFSTQVADLSPLVEMPLTVLNVFDTPTSDLSPLRGMSLVGLNCDKTQVSDLTPLRGMPLRGLGCTRTKVFDLSPLQDCKSLTNLSAKNTKITPAFVAALQKALPNCKIDWDDPAKVAADQPNRPWNTPAFQQWVKETQALPAEKQVEAVSKKLVELNPGFDRKLTNYEGKGTPKIDKGVVTELGFVTDNVADISPVRALAGLKALTCGGGFVGGVRNGKLSDLSPLKGLPLTHFSCFRTMVSDLSPLEGMRLTSLGCGWTSVADVSPLRGMPLIYLHCAGTKVSDLSPLRGMPLTLLDCGSTQVSDLSQLTSITTLDTLKVRGAQITAASVAALQKALPNCKIDWDEPAKVAADQPNRPWNTPAFQQWVKETQALPAEKQVEAVSKKLVELNPDCSYAQMSPEFGNGVVTALTFHSGNMTNIAPVRALVGLKVLNCGGGGPNGAPHGRWSDLTPLQGMKLTSLSCTATAVSDLSPLAGMPLTSLVFNNTRVRDLSPLAGMALTKLTCEATQVSDFAPLEGMPLTFLNCSRTRVSDLSPLRGMPLKMLAVGATQVSNLSPLKGMPLTRLHFEYTGVSDLTPLEGCKSLELVACCGTKVTPADIAALQKTLPYCKIE